MFRAPLGRKLVVTHCSLLVLVLVGWGFLRGGGGGSGPTCKPRSAGACLDSFKGLAQGDGLHGCPCVGVPCPKVPRPALQTKGQARERDGGQRWGLEAEAWGPGMHRTRACRLKPGAGISTEHGKAQDTGESSVQFWAPTPSAWAGVLGGRGG